MKNFNAIIIGSTGATGRHLLKFLLNHPNCTSVTSIGRKSALNGNKDNKLIDVVIDSLYDLSETEDYWNNKDVFFNCIGTTRARAGGAKEFTKIEYGISNEAAKMASNATISHASIISAKGANHKIKAINWIHPLLYMKTMGQKEQTIISKFSFKSSSIYRPGMLIRLENKPSFMENILDTYGFGIRVDILALSMVRGFIRQFSNLSTDSISYYIGNANIKKIV